uniref:Groucho/TLE N-terminal Q-rich domain-containing protein n=1 Tax=Coturnix japonica TaxID=93934 RepID=A0A8C2UFM4_COTJA
LLRDAPDRANRAFKFTIAESCDRIKEEFQFLQAQYHSTAGGTLEYDKLANEKTEMQRHYVMYYEMSYGLNIEMHKQVSAGEACWVGCFSLLPKCNIRVFPL